MTELVSDSIPTLLRISDALIVPLSRSNKAGGGLLNRASGGVFAANGELIKLAAPSRPDSLYFDDEFIDPNKIEVYEVRDAAIYGGVIYEHYGHFLVETMARLWLLEHPVLSDFPIIFHCPPGYKLKSYQSEIFKALGVLDRVRLCQRSTQVGYLVIPECSFKYSQWSYKAFEYPFENIGRKFTSTPSKDRIYVSRSQLGSAVSIPEGEIEDLFRAEGYRIAYPETLPFDEQVRLFRDHSVFAGIAGSAMHNVLFSNPEVRVSYVNRFKAVRPTFRIIDELKRIDALYVNAYVPLAPEPVEPPDPVRLDIESIYVQLKEAGVLTVTRYWTPADKQRFDDDYYAAAYLRRSEKNRWVRNYEQALRECDAGLALLPGNAQLLLQKGHNVRNLEGLDQALQIWRQALLIHPHDEGLLQTLVEWGPGSLDEDGYRLIAQRFMEIDHETDKSLYLAARIHFDAGRIDKCLDKLSAVKRKDVKSYVLTARCLLSQEQTEGALAEFLKALEIESNNSSVLHQVSCLYQRLEDFDAAYIFASQAAQSSPSDKGLRDRATKLKSFLY